MNGFLTAFNGDVLLIVLGIAAGVATWLGGSAALRHADKIHLVLGFSAGAVIGVALLDLLPEAITLAPPALGASGITAVVAGGFVAYLVIDRAFLLLSGGGSGHRGHFGAGSLTAHSLLDGVGIGLGFQLSPTVGAVLAIAVLAHDLADGMNTVNLSLRGAGDVKTARRWLFADAAAPLIGIAVSRLIVLDQTQLALAIAVFTGFFLYIGASELLPDSQHRHPHPWTTVATVLGVALIGAVVRLASTG